MCKIQCLGTRPEIIEQNVSARREEVRYSHARESPLTASPVPSTSRSSPSIRLLIRFGRVIGLARPIDARIVGLANGSVPLCEIGDDATDPAAEDVIGTGIGPRDEDPERGIYIGERFSRRTEGDTARRLDDVGYGSKRSSSTSIRTGQSVKGNDEMRIKRNEDLHFRLLVRTAEEDVGGGVYLHW